MLTAALAILLGGLSSAGAHEVTAIDGLYFRRGQSRHLEESLTLLQGLLARAPDDPELLWRLARSLVRSGEGLPDRQDQVRLFRRAEEAARRAVERAPDSAEAHFWLGVAMARRGQARGVLSSLFMVGPLRREMAEVLRLEPRHGGAHHVLGQVYAQLPALAGGDKDAALREFELAVSLSPGYTVNYVVLAQAYAAAGRKDEARATLRRLFLVEQPADPATLDQDLAEGRRLLEKL